MKKTKLKAFIVCLIIILTAVLLSVWAAASEPHGAVEQIYTDSGGGRYTLYADGYLNIEGYAGGEPEEGVLLLAGRVKSMELKSSTVTAESKALFLESANLTELSFTDTSFKGDMSRLLSGCKNLERADMSKADLTGCVNMTQLFSGCTALKSVDLSDITASDKMNAYRIFENCKSLETADMTGFNFGKTSLYAFFEDCPKLREVCLKGVDTSNVKAMNFMFYGCVSLKSLDLSDLDTGNVSDYHDMFTGCTALEYLDVSGFDLTDTGNQMERMFDGLASLKEINLSGFKTAGVTQMSYMFRDCKSLERLDLSGFDTSLVSNVQDMFKGCTSLKELNVSGFDLSRVSSLSYLFSGLSSLESIDLSGFKVMSGRSLMATNLFDGCKSLKYLDLSDTELKNAMLYQAFNNVGFWELRLPETSKSGFPCFAGNTPPEKPYYTWDGDWSYYTDGAGTAVRDDVLQGSSDVTSSEQTCLDTVRIQNAASAIRITANFTPIGYPVNIRFTDTDGNVLATESRQYSIEDKAVFSALNRDYAEGMCEGYGFAGFTSEKLGITGAGEVTAPEVPCGDIEITVLMKLPEPETEPETTAEPETTPETEGGTSEDATEPGTEPESSEGAEGTAEYTTAGTEGVENTDAPEKTTGAGTGEAQTSGEAGTLPDEGREPSETAPSAESGTGSTEPPMTTGTSETDTAAPDVGTKAPWETEPHGDGSETETASVPPVTEPKPDTALPGTTPETDASVNTGDKCHAAVMAALLAGLFFIVCAVIRCGSVRRGKKAFGNRKDR